MAIVRMLEMVARNGSLEHQVSELPKYHTIKNVFACDDDLKQKMLSSLKENHKDEKINTLDGLRIDYEDGWVIMRPSGTEPKFRITTESKDPDVVEKRAMLFKKEYESIYEKLRS